VKPGYLRYITLLAIVLMAGAGTILITGRETPAVPTVAATTNSQSTAVPMQTYLIDVAGWYEITPNESAVASPFMLTIDGLKSMPTTIGRWTGAPYDYGAAVEQWFENPDLAVSSFYQDDRGHQAWFSAFGSRGRKSYFLFEHTPITSYPAAGWTLIENGVAVIPIGTGHINVQRATLTRDNERRIVFYWYLWSDFNRNPEQGVMTMRLHIPVLTNDQDTIEAGADFLRSVFPQVVSWRRF
jgi:hypothetical protein